VETGRILGIFPTVRYPLQDTGFAVGVYHRVEAAVDSAGPVDPRTAALCSLIVSIGLERRLFPDRARAARRRLTEIAKGDWAGEAVRAAVRDVQAAMAATAVMAAVAAGS
jgi:hypothetical protein